MKKRILFDIHYLEIGGAEMSLLSLLHSIDYGLYDVDLFVHDHRGELMASMPKQVNLLPEIAEYKQIEQPLRQVLEHGYIRIAAARLVARFQSRRLAHRNAKRYKGKAEGLDNISVYSYVARRLSRILPNINPSVEYDLAVSWLIPHDYVLKRVRARRKAAWIHTDYTRVGVDAAIELPVWGGYGSIVAISDSVKRGFLSLFPSLENKIVEIPNLVNSRLIREMALQVPLEQVQKEMPAAEGRVNLLSVGRFSYAKNYDNVPDILRRIREDGVDTCWYLIGFGADEALIRKRIAEAGMEQYVIILGKKDNPYPYMKACDIYVQPSRYEGSPVTVMEAKALCKPVAVSSFPTSTSVVEDGVDGVIVPQDIAGCAEALCGLCKDKELLASLQTRLEQGLEFSLPDPLVALL